MSSKLVYKKTPERSHFTLFCCVSVVDLEQLHAYQQNLEAFKV